METMRGVVYLEAFNTSADLSGISLYQNTVDLLVGLDEIGHRHFMEFVLPSNKRKITWPDGMFDAPWIRPWMIDTDHTPPFDHYPVPAEAIEPFMPKLIGSPLLDYVINGRFMHTAAIQNCFWASRNQFGVPIELPVITWLWETGTNERLPAFKEDGGKAAVLSSALSGPVIVMKQEDKDWLLDLVFDLAPSKADQVYYRTEVVNAVADLTGVEGMQRMYTAQRLERAADKKKPVLFHGGSGEKKRRIEPMLAAVAELPDLVDVVLTTQWTRKVNHWENQATVYKGVNHEGYLNMLGKGDICFIGAEHETTGLAYLEAVHSGMLPIVFDAPWFEELIPDDYPFVAKTWPEFQIMLRTMVKSLTPLKVQWTQLLRDVMIESFSAVSVAAQWHESVYKLTAPYRERNLHYVRGIKPAFDLLKRAVEEENWPVVTPTQAWDAMGERSDKDLNFKFIVPNTLRYMLIALGYRDDCRGPDLIMIRD